MTPRSLPAALVISLDLELHWGVRDHCGLDSPYVRNLHGARVVVPRLLELFRRYDVHATWATVGFLFAGSREEVLRWRPKVLPTYEDPALFPYNEPVGDSEAADPLHFGASLIDSVRSTPGQEIATHTFSHYFCTEPGQTAEQFAADLDAAIAIARSRDLTIRSIVFPRNQHNPAYDHVLRSRGVDVYRGNARGWMWRFRGARDSAHPARRIARFADTYLPISGDGSVAWEDVIGPSGLYDVRASFFVRPVSRRLAVLEPMRLRRLRSAIRSAARRGRIVHLWWHPHNFGAEPERCLDFLHSVLEEFDLARRRFGMRSLTMEEVARLAGGREAEWSRHAEEKSA